MDRNTLLLGEATHASRIIEIGPSHAPIAPKRTGWNSFVVDHADQAELREKYTGYPVDLDAIEPVDAVWRGGRLDHAVPAEHHGSFDRLIASHVIEHIPDLVTFLVASQTLLSRTGALALAVPDKRYCFDVLKPISTTGDVLAAHNPTGPGRHSRRTIFNQVAYSVGLDGTIAWGQQPVANATFMNSLTDAFEIANRHSDAPDSAYVDAHAWQFTPCAFRLTILELADGGLIDWHIADCTPAIGSEFIATLRRGRPTWPSPAAREARRLELLLGILVEQHEMIELAAQGGLIDLPANPAIPAIPRALAEIRSLITTRLDSQERHLSSITAANGTQASIMGSLAMIATQQHHHHQAIDDAAHQLNAQQKMLSEVHGVTQVAARLLRPLRRLRAWILERRKK